MNFQMAVNKAKRSRAYYILCVSRLKWFLITFCIWAYVQDVSKQEYEQEEEEAEAATAR